MMSSSKVKDLDYILRKICRRVVLNNEVVIHPSRERPWHVATWLRFTHIPNIPEV